MTRTLLAAAVVAGLLPAVDGRDDPKTGPRQMFTPGEFPPAGSGRRIDGELVAADFVHRAGRFRTAGTGELNDFTLPPYGVVSYLGADADLRDVPLGTHCRFLLHPDSRGEFTRLALMRDQATPDTAGGFFWRLAAEGQRQRHAAFLKARGLAGWVERTDGRTLTVTLFGGDRAAFERTWLKDFAAGRDAHVVVANDELRTWNPPVDNERGKIVEVIRDPVGGYGNSGVRLRVTVNHMLEGFRKGRVVRVFAGGWPLRDQPFGEQLFHYGARHFPPDLAEFPPKEYPDQFPFRTDAGNDHLPWYRLKPGVAPPPHAEHSVFGELVAADPVKRTGRFRADRSERMVDFALIPEGTVRSLGAAANLSAIPPGTRCRFGLYQDETGAFTRAGLVTDEASDLVATGAVWRVTALDPGTGKLEAARQPPAVKNDQGDPEQPPDVGHAEFRVGPDTRVWKGDGRVAVRDLAVGDVLLVNVTGERPGHPSHCTDVWVGADTHKLVTDRAAKTAAAPKR